jgi:hypothetical protein
VIYVEGGEKKGVFPTFSLCFGFHLQGNEMSRHEKCLPAMLWKLLFDCVRVL